MVRGWDSKAHSVIAQNQERAVIHEQQDALIL